MSQGQDRLELFLRECDVSDNTSSFRTRNAFINVPHQNGKRDQVRKHFQKLCQEIPQKPIVGCYHRVRNQRPGHYADLD